ncbi:MAG: Ig-like domain-containing protein [Caldilineaceae bacterium]|nr:Ig-like domain-containing protein [Caldilineaceae bacterium]
MQLTVNRGDGPKQAAIPVTIDNTPPTVIITEPKPDQLFVMEDDEQININVLANDNLAIGRVEYLIDNSAFVTSTVAPYNERWEIEMRDLNSAAGGTPWPAFESDDPEVQPGTVATFPDGFQAIVTNGGVYFEGHVIKVIGYDAAGNRAESDEVRVYVRHKKK